MSRGAIVLAAVALALASAAVAEEQAEEQPGETRKTIIDDPGGEDREGTPQDETREMQEMNPPSAVESTDSGRGKLSEVVVEAKKPMSAASSQDIRAQDFAMRPHATIQEILNNIPGLVVTQHQGGGKAYQYLIRGFDSDHGTDIAINIDGVPVNMVSHAHGQGYADLNFVIPEMIKDFQLYKGPYFPQFGDFATAAALQFHLVDEFKEDFVHAEGGSFQTMRYVTGASHPIGNVMATAAAQVYFSNGPFISPENFERYNGFLKFTLAPTPDSKLAIWGSAMKSTWDASGQIPNRAVLDGSISRFGSEDDSEGGKTDREDLVLNYANKITPFDEITAMAWATHYSLKLDSDFTLFKDSGLRFIKDQNGDIIDTRGVGPIFGEANYIPGDGLRQTDGRAMFGAKLAYTRDWDLFGIPSQTQVGVQNRDDTIDLTLGHQVRRSLFFTTNDVHVWESSLGLFAGQQFFPTEWLRLELGLRGDIFWFDVANELGPEAPDPNFYSDTILGKTTDSIVSPKANLVITPVENTDIYLNFGTGFHSNDARATVPNTINSMPPTQPFVPAQGFTPLTRALGYELGGRTKLFERLDLASALWVINLADELVFSGDGGTLEPLASRTQRWGVDFEARYQITSDLFFDYDLTWDDPRQVPSGLAVPLAPTLLMNGGVTYTWFEGFQTGIRVRYLDNRPGNEDRTITVPGYTLVDLIARYRWQNVELAVDLLNVTNTAWDQAAFVFGTCLRNEETVGSGVCNPRPAHTFPDGVDDINFTPGDPIAVRAGLTVFF